MKPKINERIPEDELKTAFDLFDRNNSGYISKSDLRNAMKILGQKDLTKKEIISLSKKVKREKEKELSLQQRL